MRQFVHLLLFAGLSLSTVAAPNATELAELFLPAELDNPKLSPDGDYLGFLGRRGDKYTVGVFDLRTGKMDLSDPDGNVRPLEFWWKTPRRLLIRTSNYKLNALGFTAFDVDGRNVEDVWRLANQPGVLLDAQVDDARHVLMLNAQEIMQVDLGSGRARTVERSPVPTGLWVIDAQGHARATFRSNSRFGTADFYWKPAATGDWRNESYKSGDRRFVPQAVDAAGRLLWGWTWSPRTQISVASFDTQTGAIEARDFLKGAEPTHLLKLGSTRIPIAVAYAQGATVRLFALDEKYRDGVSRLQQSFEGFFPVILDALPDDKTWLVWIGNSRLPGAYFRFNRLTGEAGLIGMSHNAAISEDRLAAGEYFTFPQRGGGTLSARLWRPAAKAPLPLIVMSPSRLPSHPALDVYQPDVQALVAQGFAVVQVNVRGTLGFGQPPVDITQDADWATFIQEDLEDAVDELVRHGIADAKSVNLLGRRLGAVLAIEVATRSNRFTALASLNAPAKVDRYDLMRFSDDESINVLSSRLGGWLASARLASDLSPVRQVSELKIPALFLHDEDSIRGRPDEDGRSIRSALVKAKAPTKTGLAFSWSEKPKPPSLIARENASIALQIGTFFHHPTAK